MCCGYCREQWLCAVVIVGNSGLCYVYCREQCVSSVGTVGNSVFCCGYCREQWLCALYKQLPARIKNVDKYNRFRREAKSILLHNTIYTLEEYLQATLE